MRVVVHGGMQKTGSSALQEYFANARHAFEQAGIIYPDFGHREHWQVTAAFVPRPENYHHMRRRFRGKDVDAAVAGTRAELARLLRDGGSADTLLISHEDLSVPRTLARLASFLAKEVGPDLDLTFLAYVRDPVRMYPSSIQQALKTHRDRSFLPSTWLSPHLKRAAGLERPPNARMILRQFAPPNTPGWDVIEDFRGVFDSVIGRELPTPTSSAEVNRAMSREACAVLELARTVPGYEVRLKGFQGVVRVFDAEREGSRLSLPEGWSEDIAATNAKAWNAVAPMLDHPDGAEPPIIEAHPSGRAYADRDIHRWLIEGLDEDYCRALAVACSGEERPRLRLPAGRAWLESEVIGKVAEIVASA